MFSYCCIEVHACLCTPNQQNDICHLEASKLRPVIMSVCVITHTGLDISEPVLFTRCAFYTCKFVLYALYIEHMVWLRLYIHNFFRRRFCHIQCSVHCCLFLFLFMLPEGRAYSPCFVHPTVGLSVHRNRYILVCLKILDTSMYFNEIYSSVPLFVRLSLFCPEHISKSIEGNFMKLVTLIEGHEKNCRMQE